MVEVRNWLSVRRIILSLKDHHNKIIINKTFIFMKNIYIYKLYLILIRRCYVIQSLYTLPIIVTNTKYSYSIILLTKHHGRQAETQNPLNLGKCTLESEVVIVVAVEEGNSIIAFCNFLSCNHLHFVHICKEKLYTVKN